MERRSVSGRPSGTDGSDYSYRMVVDSRYTRVAKGKSSLSRLLLLQGLIVLAAVPLVSLPVVKGEDPNVLALSSLVLSFVSLIIGGSGQRHSKATFLKTYLIFSSVAMLLSAVCVMKSNLPFEVFQEGIVSCWEKHRVQSLEALHVFVGGIVQVFAAITTLSLIHNMSPPKRSS